MNDLQETLNRMVAAERARVFAEQPQMSLGQIIDACKTIEWKDVRDDPPEVVFDFEYAVPTRLDSWRGVYAELALGFTMQGDGPKLPDFITMLEAAVGQSFDGYKGGTYWMDRRTPVWVANYGHSGNTGVVAVLDKGWRVVLATGWCEV